jgi:xanthine dehydrogenase accessory factor
LAGLNQKNIYSILLEQHNNGKNAVLISSAIAGNLSQTVWQSAAGFLAGKPESGIDEAERLASDAEQTGCLRLVNRSDNDFIIAEPYTPQPQLIIFGGGHIAVPLADFAARTGFGVTVVDDRPKFANSARFPTADRVICESFEKAFDSLDFHQATYVVIVTRGHRHDQTCLENTLAKRTAYTGMIGSRRRLAIVFEDLKRQGFDADALANVHSPIGLKINAVTPEEIAVAILAELIQVRRSVPAAAGQDKKCYKDNDLDVLRALAANENEPKAIVTVIATKGSAPRKAGAKMIIYPDGRTVGSIGGGCSEGEVIVKGRSLIRKGSGYITHRVDLTGEAAEDEGMVCGGIMDVLIEYGD